MVLLLAVALTFITAVSLAAILRVIYPPLWRDVYTLFVSYKVIRKTRQSCTTREFVVDQFERHARVTPDAPFIIFKDSTFSYKLVDLQANRVARALLEYEISLGDTVALVMSNEPAFIWLYLGIQKLGARASLVNHHLEGDSLLHSLTTCFPKLVIVGDGHDAYLPGRVFPLKSSLENTQVVTYGPSRPPVDLPCFSDAMDRVSSEQLDLSLRSTLKLGDPCAFIYTSGTTGLPKPAIISHMRAVLHSHCFSPLGFSHNDVMYLTLPLYHASATNLALLNVISVGATVVLREKFSASQFWSDCCKYEVTSFQYIGEMLRYLVNSPTVPEETLHKVTAAIGNGLRPDIWTKFKNRFKVKQIYEFYGSTEVPASVNNLFNIPGSVGRLSPLLSAAMNLRLVRMNTETNQPLRNSEGRCELIGPGESGLLLAQLSDKVSFDGYLGPVSQTTSRILQNVLKDGDFYVNTNDIFTLDQDYNMFFKDRIGDSFRWKGENVSTAEVSNVMNRAGFVQDTNVFGVAVPGCEGKAGMAAINLKEEESLDEDKLEELAQLCKEKLPVYARPRFIRVQRQMSLTSTFKQQKTELVKEGFNPAIVEEPLFYLDKSSSSFKPLNNDVYQDIADGRVML